jgi:hypothetical protein
MRHTNGTNDLKRLISSPLQDYRNDLPGRMARDNSKFPGNHDSALRVLTATIRMASRFVLALFSTAARAY